MALDLSLLPHLSEAALREEAARRGLDSSALDREALIAAIRASGQGASREEADPSASTPDPHPRRGERRGTVEPRAKDEREPVRSLKTTVLTRAKGLFREVTRAARRRLSPGSDAPAMLALPPPAAEEEPIKTLSMAELLLSQGHAERAATILRELRLARPEDVEVAARLSEAEGRVGAARLKEAVSRELAEAESARVVLVAEGARRAVGWKVDEAGRERAEALLGAPGQLCLRVVRIGAAAGRVVRETNDREVRERGFTELEAAPSDRLVVSIGIVANGRFASIAHAACCR